MSQGYRSGKGIDHTGVAPPLRIRGHALFGTGVQRSAYVVPLALSHHSFVCRGFTFTELVTALLVVGIMVAIVGPRTLGWADRLATRRATAEIMSFYQRARFGAIVRGTRVRIEFGRDVLRAVHEGVHDSSVTVVPGPGRHGVNFTASRGTIRIAPNGLGWGAANTKLVLRRGAAAESLTISRLGRLKRW